MLLQITPALSGVASLTLSNHLPEGVTIGTFLGGLYTSALGMALHWTGDSEVEVRSVTAVGTLQTAQLTLATALKTSLRAGTGANCFGPLSGIVAK